VGERSDIFAVCSTITIRIITVPKCTSNCKSPCTEREMAVPEDGDLSSLSLQDCVFSCFLGRSSQAVALDLVGLTIVH